MAATVKLVYRKDKKNDMGIAPINVRFIKDRKVHYISTGIRMEEKYWDYKGSKVKPSYPNSARTNNLLNRLLFEYEDKGLKEQMQNLKISARALKEKVTGQGSKSFFDVANQQWLGGYCQR